MFTKAGLLIALLLVFMGYRWGKRKALERTQQQPVQAQAPAPAAASAPKQPTWLSVRVLLGIVIILLCIAILTSLQR